MYGSEKWALNRYERRKIEKAENEFLRRVSGCTFTDHARNPTIHSELRIYCDV
jgi:hypothetical protein